MSLPSFYHPSDEAHFYKWLNLIPEIVHVELDARVLKLTFKRFPMTNSSLHGLSALFIRYNVPPSEFRRFESKSNRKYSLS
jgi:hypothetical protein